MEELFQRLGFRRCARRQPHIKTTTPESDDRHRGVPERGSYQFPDGSAYTGETLNGRMHGQGEWRSPYGDMYVGSFCEDRFYGKGEWRSANGEKYVGNFTNGEFDGIGTFIHSDGRAEIGGYSNGQCDNGKRIRWSAARNQAWRLIGNNVDADVSLSEAAEFAASLGLQVPGSIYMVPSDGQQRLHDKLLRISNGQIGEELACDAHVPTEYGNQQGHLVSHSKCALVEDRVCDGIIAECEARAKALGGWTTKRHDSNPTTDVPVQRLPRTHAWFSGKLLPDIAYPFLASSFGFALPRTANKSFCVTDAFVVKYDASAGQRFLKPHRDGSGQLGSATVFSFNVALNSSDEYEGGGTYFRRLEGNGTAESAGSVRSQKGHILAHSSALWHGGHPITSGVRYILVAFVSIDADYADWAFRFYEHVRSVDDPDPEG